MLLARARTLLGTDPPAAQALYEQVLDERPEQPEALTYSGWLLFVASNGASPDAAGDRHRHRPAADGPGRRPPTPRTPIRTASWPSSPATPTADLPTARAEIDQCLALDPPAEIRGLVEQFAASLDATATTSPPVTTVPG